MLANCALVVLQNIAISRSSHLSQDPLCPFIAPHSAAHPCRVPCLCATAETQGPRASYKQEVGMVKWGGGWRGCLRHEWCGQCATVEGCVCVCAHVCAHVCVCVAVGVYRHAYIPPRL